MLCFSETEALKTNFDILLFNFTDVYFLSLERQVVLNTRLPNKYRFIIWKALFNNEIQGISIFNIFSISFTVKNENSHKKKKNYIRNTSNDLLDVGLIR